MMCCQCDCNVKPHLSKHQLEDAKECFVFHTQTSQPNLDRISSLTSNGGDSGGNMSNAQRLKRIGSVSLQDIKRMGGEFKRSKLEPQVAMSLSEMRQAVMDLGFFPTSNEILNMHRILSKGRNSSVVDMGEFIAIIKMLTLAELSNTQMEELAALFSSYCDDQGNLSREDLANLMMALGHPEDKQELDALMHEWDIANTGYLDFDAFVSMIAVVLKNEELDDLVEEDFLSLCERSHQKRGLIALRMRNVNREPEITLESLLRNFTKMGVLLRRDVAEEMVFDATGERDGRVSLSDLLDTIRMSGRNEIMADDSDLNVNEAQSAREALHKSRRERGRNGGSPRLDPLQPLGRGSPRNSMNLPSSRKVSVSRGGSPHMSPLNLSNAMGTPKLKEFAKL